MKIPLAVHMVSLPLDFEPALRQIAAPGFTHVDPIALVDRPASHLEALAETGLLVSCVSIGRGLPEGCTLDAQDLNRRRIALDLMKQHVADAARLGATRAYVVPGTDTSDEALARFTDAVVLLAEYAAERMVVLCVEPVPGRTLSHAFATLDWLERTGSPSLKLLLDVGHCLITREDPAAVIARAGGRLGYVHLDDNDGAGDLHWPLLTGRLTRDGLHATLTALARHGYRAPVGLELLPSPTHNPDPVAALTSAKLLLEGLAT